MNTTRQKNILLVAEEAAGVRALQVLSNCGHTLSGVLTTADSSIFTMAQNLEIPVQDASRVQEPEFAAWMESNHIDVLLNVHSLYRICPEVVQAARVGAFNLHPGPLPAYSGLNVPSWAVYNEEPKHAVTIHRMSGRIDTGDIVYETQFPLSSTDTGLTVSINCAQKGLELIERLLGELSQDSFSVSSRAQDLSQRILYKRNQIPGNGFIQWSEPAHKIDAFVRACNYSPFPSPWGEPKTRQGNQEVSILKIEISNKVCHEAPGTVRQMIDGKIAIATADYWILVNRCKVDGEAVFAASLLNHGDLLTYAF